MKRSGCSEPRATATNAPMPRRLTWAGPWTLHWIWGSRPSVLAASANKLGVAWLAGRLLHSRANSTPATRATPQSNPGRAPAASDTPSTPRPRPRASALDLGGGETERGAAQAARLGLGLGGGVDVAGFGHRLHGGAGDAGLERSRKAQHQAL